MTTGSIGSRRHVVFISHDARDSELAEQFGQLLTAVSAGVLKPFYSSNTKPGEGVPYGVDWFDNIMERLEEACDVVCILTRLSVERPWILYEAGAARGYKRAQVYGIAFDIELKEIFSTPFAHFQNGDLREESLVKLVVQLLQRIPYAEPDDNVVLVQVRRFLENTRKSLNRSPRRTLEEMLDQIERILLEPGNQTTYVGRYPDFFDRQVLQILDGAKSSILIACDYPAYGFVTYQALFSRYRSILHEKAEQFKADIQSDSRRGIRMIVPNESVRRELIRFPFPNTANWVDVISQGNYKEGIRALQVATNRESIPGFNEFYEAIVEINTIEGKAFPFEVTEVARRLAIFAWIVDDRTATFAIPTYQKRDASIEHAFTTTDRALIEALNTIVVGYIGDEGTAVGPEKEVRSGRTNRKREP